MARRGVAGSEAFAREREAVAVDHARGVDRAGEQRLHRVALAADVIAVLADAARRGARPRRLDARRSASASSGISVACGESAAPTPTRLPRRSRERRDRAVGAHEHDARQIAVGVAHRDRLRRGRAAPRGRSRSTRAASSTRRRSRRAGAPRPGARSSSTGRSRTARPRAREVRAEALPDRDDLRVVRDGAEHECLHRAPQNSGRPQTALPMKS